MMNPKHPDPTPEEIRQATEAIRLQWTPQECVRRSGEKPVPWMPPLLSANDFPAMSWDMDASSN